jgi:IS30 family transposase
MQQKKKSADKRGIAYFWVSNPNKLMSQFAQLTLQQRYQLAGFRQLQMAQKDIALHLGVSPATISRELKRNGTTCADQPYEAEGAQQKAYQRSQRSPYKLRGALADQVLVKLRQRYSPEQISGVLDLESGRKRISHEAIYHYVYQQTAQGENLTQYLRIRHRKRYKKRGEPEKRGSIPGRVGIEHRSAIVETNTQVGHWEGDTVIGADHDGVLLTLVERVTKYTCIVKLASKNAKLLAQAVVQCLRWCGLPTHSLTFDNGKEFTDHATITADLECPVFFACPHHPWERGLNENTNGLIRQYIPKQQRIGPLSKDFVSSIETALNNRPRKTLGFLSPLQYAVKQGVAFQT